MSDLARVIVDAAGEAVWNEIKKYPKPQPDYGGSVGWGATQQDVGRVAAEAVLNKLAEAFAGIPGIARVFLLVAKEIQDAY